MGQWRPLCIRSSLPDDRCFHSGFVRLLMTSHPFTVLKYLLSGRIQPRLLPKFPPIPKAVSTSQNLDDEHGFRHLSGPGEIRMVRPQLVYRLLPTVENLGPEDVAFDLRRAKVQRMRSTVDHGLEPLEFPSPRSRHDHRRIPTKRRLFGTVLK